jgi:nitroreductase
MQFLELAERRRSVRRFQATPVPRKALQKVLQAANRAPSAGGLQAYEIVIVEEQDRRSALAEAAYQQDFVASAPFVLVFFANPNRNAARYGKRGVSLYCIQDATIAAAYAQLAAAALALASCWVGAFDERKVARLLGATDYLRPIAMLPIGYPAEEPQAIPRRALDALVRHERF